MLCFFSHLGCKRGLLSVIMNKEIGNTGNQFELDSSDLRFNLSLNFRWPLSHLHQGEKNVVNSNNHTSDRYSDKVSRHNSRSTTVH